MKKTILVYFGVTFLIHFIAYFGTSFVKLEMNPSLWEEQTRYLLTFLPFLLGALVLILLECLKKLRDIK